MHGAPMPIIQVAKHLSTNFLQGDKPTARAKDNIISYRYLNSSDFLFHESNYLWRSVQICITRHQMPQENGYATYPPKTWNQKSSQAPHHIYRFSSFLKTQNWNTYLSPHSSNSSKSLVYRQSIQPKVKTNPISDQISSQQEEIAIHGPKAFGREALW